MEPAFDQDALIRRLSGLSALQRLAFAASCYLATEQHYRAFVDEMAWGNAQLMHEWAMHLWDVSRGAADLDAQALQRMNTQWDVLVPDLDEFDSLLTSEATDAALILTYATAVAETGSATEAAYTGYQAMTLADLLAQEAEAMDLRDSQLEEKILAHSLMQTELRRQAHLLLALESGVELTVPSTSG